jgi:hypothetical protein
MRLNNIVLANLVLAQVIWADVCSAQAPPTVPATAPTSSTRPMYKAGSRRGAPQETLHKALQSMPASIPVPVPPDAKFVTGYQSQYAGARASTYVRMNTDNQPATLVDWYRQNLKAYGWAFKEKASTKTAGLPTLSGTKGGVTCLINFEGPLGKLNKTTAIMITFNEPR